MTFFSIHWKSFPESARNHHKLCTSLFRRASFRHRFCSSCVVLPDLLPGMEGLYRDFHGWLKCFCTQGGWSEAGARASPDPEHGWRWAHSTQSDLVTTGCSKFVLMKFPGTDRNPLRGKGGWLEECQGGAAFSGGWKHVLHVWLLTLVILLTLSPWCWA